MLDDLVAGAARLAHTLPDQRMGLAAQMLYEAHAAHHYFKRFHRPHPVWGNGSLMTRALKGGPWQHRPVCFTSMAIMAAAVAKFQHKSIPHG